MVPDLNRFHGCLLGLAVGDAVGTTVEFKRRGELMPVGDMVGGGPFGLQPGQWTDDTSMALCLATSLVVKKDFDPVDQMDRYWNWYQNGYLSSTGKCFDIGNTVRSALERFQRTGDPFSGSTSPDMAGNGSLMRLAPVPMFYFPDLEKVVHFAGESSRTTHGTLECIEACQLFAEMVFCALSGGSKNEILFNSTLKISGPNIMEISRGSYSQKSAAEIRGTWLTAWKRPCGVSSMLVPLRKRSCRLRTSAMTPTPRLQSVDRLPAPIMEKQAFLQIGWTNYLCGQTSLI